MTSLGSNYPVYLILALGVFATGIQHVYIAAVCRYALGHGGQRSLFHDASFSHASLGAGGSQIWLVGANLGYVAAQGRIGAAPWMGLPCDTFGSACTCHCSS